MSHEIYQSTAMILMARNMRESNKLFALYTERFGLLYVSAQSIREMRAKMRFHAHPLSLVEVDLVQGRDMWKLVGIHENVSSLTFATDPWYTFLDNMSSLVLRLCTGEEAHPDIWKDIVWLYQQDPETYDLELLEVYITIRLLYFLGYWEGDLLLLEDDSFSQEQQAYIQNKRSSLIQKINHGLQASQL